MTATVEHFVEHFASAGGPVQVEVFLPKAPGRHPACLILHGTFGLLPQYRGDIVSFAEALADQGVVAALPHYFESTGTSAGLPATVAVNSRLPQWRAACGAALGFMHDHSRVNAGRLGVLGFSLGGHLAMSLGMTPPAGASLKCVVDFFGPTIDPPLVGNRAAMPPILIHHGEGDELVSILNSERLVAQLMGAGKTEGLGFKFIRYPGQGHGFAGAALDSSRSATIEFLTAVL